MFSRMLADSGGLGRWVHYREPAPLDHQTIIRLNRDTLYSQAIVDVTGGAELTVPTPVAANDSDSQARTRTALLEPAAGCAGLEEQCVCRIRFGVQSSWWTTRFPRRVDELTEGRR